MGGAELLELLPALSKAGPAALVLSTFLGLSYLVTAWRGGSVAEKKEQDTAKRLADLEVRLTAAEDEIGRLKNLLHDMRYQRDQARLRVEFLEMTHGVNPRTVWTPDEEEHP